MGVEIKADDWNADRLRLERAWPIGGLNTRVRELPGGLAIDAAGAGEWEHPWTIAAYYEFLDPPPSPEQPGEWRAMIKPGFVNGRDAHIPMPEAWFKAQKLDVPEVRDVPLTEEIAPYLRLTWRNPLKPSSIGASSDGEIVFGAGEGYPKFFEKIGVRPAAKGGRLGKIGAMEGENAPNRTREIRACDIVLAQPRPAQRLNLQPNSASLATGEPLLDIQTTFATGYAASRGNRATLRATSKYTPPDPNARGIDAIFGFLLDGGDAEQDELLMSTVWLVSPPDADSEAEPDHTWTPYAQYFVFWNLNYATRTFIDFLNPEPITFSIPLAAGAAQPVINSILASQNEMFAEALASLDRTDVSGAFWSI
jgi:hypothetical protein